MNFLEQLVDYLSYLSPFVIINGWEKALRVRLGKQQKVFGAGIYLRIPFIDEFYVQPVRLRVVGMPLQSLTSKDGKDLSIKGALTYQVVDIQKMYNEIHSPETTIINIAADLMSEYCINNNFENVDRLEFLHKLKSCINEGLQEFDYGIQFDEFRITAFSAVRTYRLIQDQHWEHESDEDIL